MEEKEVSSIAELREKLSEEIPQVEKDPAPPKEIEAKTEEKVEEIKAESSDDKAVPEDKGADVKDAAAPAFTPDFKFRVFDKDHEIPEKFRALIKDEASQKEVKEIFEKAFGLEAQKPKYESAKQKIEEYETKVIPAFQEQNKIINELAHYVKVGDWDSYFQVLGIDKKNIQEWMYRDLTLSPEQKALYDKSRELQKQLLQFETENRELKGTVDASQRETQQRAEQQILLELDFTLEKGDYKDAVQAYDAINGKDAFKSKVIQFAAFKYQTEGKNLGVEDAVKEWLSFQRPTTASTGTTTNNNGVVRANPQSKPVLPQVGAKPMSPSTKPITSIKQLREKAEAARSEA